MGLSAAPRASVHFPSFPLPRLLPWYRSPGVVLGAPDAWQEGAPAPYECYAEACSGREPRASPRPRGGPVAIGGVCAPLFSRSGMAEQHLGGTAPC